MSTEVCKATINVYRILHSPVPTNNTGYPRNEISPSQKKRAPYFFIHIIWTAKNTYLSAAPCNHKNWIPCQGHQKKKLNREVLSVLFVKSSDYSSKGMTSNVPPLPMSPQALLFSTYNDVFLEIWTLYGFDASTNKQVKVPVHFIPVYSTCQTYKCT